MKFNLNKTKRDIQEEIKVLRDRNKIEKNALEYDSNLREISAYVTCLKIIESNAEYSQKETIIIDNENEDIKLYEIFMDGINTVTIKTDKNLIISYD